MDESLSDEERAALRESIERSGRAGHRAKPAPVTSRPVALIAEDQAAERVRPVALRVAERWGAHVSRVIPPLTGVKVKVALDEAVETDNSAILDAVRKSWIRELVSEHGAGAVAVAVSGRMIPDLAATMLGGVYGVAGERPLTSATLRVFSTLGERIADAACSALEHECGNKLAPGDTPASVETWPPLVEGGPLVMATATVSGESEGQLHLIAAPSALKPPRTRTQDVKAITPSVLELLGTVEAEVSVQLGTAQTTAAKFAAFEPGSVVELDALVGDPVRIFVAGEQRATGQAVIVGEMVAVEVSNVSQ